jgi:hypothetical protein
MELRQHALILLACSGRLGARGLELAAQLGVALRVSIGGLLPFALQRANRLREPLLVGPEAGELGFECRDLRLALAYEPLRLVSARLVLVKKPGEPLPFGGGARELLFELGNALAAVAFLFEGDELVMLGKLLQPRQLPTMLFGEAIAFGIAIAKGGRQATLFRLAARELGRSVLIVAPRGSELIFRVIQLVRCGPLDLEQRLGLAPRLIGAVALGFARSERGGELLLLAARRVEGGFELQDLRLCARIRLK